jgi:hypothetical protein
VTALLGATLATGCSGPPAAPPRTAVGAPGTETPVVAPRPGASPTVPATDAPATSAPAEAPAPPLCSPDARRASLAPTKFVAIHSGPALSAAVGTPPRAAVWSGRSVTVFEGETVRELPAPSLPPGAAVELFFGRDNQPRLMGFALGEPGKEVPVYLRFRQGTFRPEPSELGPLGAPRGALYGVLGFADPEVVCRPRELCLIKRTTGWKRIAAHDAPARVVLHGQDVFALHARRVEQLGERGWSAVEPERAFEEPLDAWRTPNGETWVIDRSAAGLSRLKDGRWESVPSPVQAPRAGLVRADGAVIVVGSNGASEFDGTRFRCIDGVVGPLHLAFAVGSEVWLAGERGVYRSVR